MTEVEAQSTVLIIENETPLRGRDESCRLGAREGILRSTRIPNDLVSLVSTQLDGDSNLSYS